MKVEQFLKKQHEKDSKDYGLCPVPTDAQEALNLLAKHFLGDDWYVAMPMGAEQVNTEIVCEILQRTQPSFFERILGKS